LSETQRFPFYDISLAYSASLKVGMLELGAGVNWVSAIPVRPSRTSPHGGEFLNVPDNNWKEVPFQEGKTVVDKYGDTVSVSVRVAPDDPTKAEIVIRGPINVDSSRVTLRDGKVAGMAAGFMTPPDMRDALQKLTSNNFDLYPELGGKQTQYTFSGQIVTARVALNPLGGMETSLGKDPFKVYAEAAVLGVKNYDGFYEKMNERIPIMFGVNLPTFKALDFLAFEAEFFPNKLPPSWQYRYRANVPQPGSEIEGFNLPWFEADRQKKDDWKWGLSARKTFKGFALAAQGGTDHMHSSTQEESFHDLMSRPSHWYFMSRLILYTGL
jgi:hypothetical protein